MGREVHAPGEHAGKPQDSQRRGLCRQARQGQRHTAALCFAKALALCPAPTADELVRPARMRRPQGVGAAAVPPLGSSERNFGITFLMAGK